MILSARDSDRPPDSPPAGPGEIPRLPSFLFGEQRVRVERERPREAQVGADLVTRIHGRRRRRRHTVLALALGAGLILLALVAIPRLGAFRARPAPPATAGTLVIESEPAGWHVWDGEIDRGATPLTLVLPAGQRSLVLRRGTAMRELQADVSSGGRTVYHLDLPGPPPTGDLHVSTKPPGAIVVVDGNGRGLSPVDVRDLKAGRHAVTILHGDRVLTEAVTIEAGRAASLMIPLDEAAAPAVGWVVIQSDVELEVYEGESLVGSSRNARLLFMPGRHVLRLANRDLNVDATRIVQVQPGATASVPVRLPAGSLSVNASPWAEVWMDGAKIGETPIANYAAPLGSHEVVLRHPKFGERRRLVVVAQGQPVRIGVDLRE